MYDVHRLGGWVLWAIIWSCLWLVLFLIFYFTEYHEIEVSFVSNDFLLTHFEQIGSEFIEAFNLFLSLFESLSCKMFCHVRKFNNFGEQLLYWDKFDSSRNERHGVATLFLVTIVSKYNPNGLVPSEVVTRTSEMSS